MNLDRRLLQFFLYLIVGGICFVIDVGGFMLLYREHVPVMPASVLSFVTATLANYGLCRAFVFQTGRFSQAHEIVRLFAVSIAGLALNSAVVWVLAEMADMDPRLAKALAVLPVLVWNYEGRRRIVFDRGMPRSAALIKAAASRRDARDPIFR